MSNALWINPDFVPEPPESGQWVDLLRWMIAVMDDDDRSLAFIASCLGHCLKNGGISDRQAESCGRIFQRIQNRFYEWSLDCQAEKETEELSAVVPNRKDLH